MKRLLGWLADFYPRHHFYSEDFGGQLDWSFVTGEHDDPHRSAATTAMLGVSVAAAKHLKKPGASMTCEFTNVTDAGKDIGNFRITVERLGDEQPE